MTLLSTLQHDLEILVNDIFLTCEGSDIVLDTQNFTRRSLHTPFYHCLCDTFPGVEGACLFLRCGNSQAATVKLKLAGKYQLETCPNGGWLLEPDEKSLDTYWLPQPPTLRTIDSDGHILKHHIGKITCYHLSDIALSISIDVPEGESLDLTIWRLPHDALDLPGSMKMPLTLEKQPIFLWSSHTTYERPADLYLHLVHGHVYENHEVWPKYWRVCSELDAYALYVTLTGLLRATGKRLYDLLRTQIVFSVIARQADDGGWYHGEWTDGMESHYRLHAGAIHLLASYYEETPDPAVRNALDKAVEFSAKRIDKLDAGIWFLHDDLEKNTETLKRYPFRTIPSRALGKSESNLLVLNTHLDTSIAMARYQIATKDTRHSTLLESALGTSRAVINLKSAEWLYKPLSKAIALTFLPAKQAAALPLSTRVIKRLAWQYLIPLMPRIKALFPRLVMPNGFIDRHLVQSGASVRYQPVNIMDLARTRHLFRDESYDALLEKACTFTQHSGIRARWKERKGKEDDSLGFWAEALYFMCLVSNKQKYREWLAGAVIDIEDNNLGIPPSLLGCNMEAVEQKNQIPCPSPTNSKLRVVNLSAAGTMEFLVINPTRTPLQLDWETQPDPSLHWQCAGHPLDICHPIRLSSREWLWGRQPAASPTKDSL